MRKLIFSFLLILIGSTPLFSQKVFNKNYLFGEDKKLVAFVPIIQNDFKKNDEIINDILKDTLNLAYLDVSNLRTNLTPELLDILKKVAVKDYKTKDLKEFPNLKTIINVSEIEYIKNEKQNPEKELSDLDLEISDFLQKEILIHKSKVPLTLIHRSSFIEDVTQNVFLIMKKYKNTKSRPITNGAIKKHIHRLIRDDDKLNKLIIQILK